MAKKRRDRNPVQEGARTPHSRPALPPDWISFALALAGVLLTAYLTLSAMNRSEVAFCGAGSGCDVVQGSQWANLLGLPIAFWGFGLYALIAVFAVVPTRAAVKRWRRIWSLSLLGTAISLYLTAVAFFALDAFCLWCLASLALIVTLFVIATVRRPDTAPGMPWRNWLTNTAIVVLVVVGTTALAQSGMLTPPEDPRLKALAEHLEAREVKFYGAYWCPNCREQKELFGRSAERLPYVECSPSGRNGAVAFECVSAGIGGYPTWVIRGRSYTEVLTPEVLAQRSGFDWNGFEPPADE